MPKLGHFGPNFLILTKFRMHPILEALILNVKFAFCGSSQRSTHTTANNSILSVLQFFLEKVFLFSFLPKSQNIMAPFPIILKVLIASMTLKKISIF